MNLPDLVTRIGKQNVGRSGFFVEVGANDGIQASNTLGLEEMGWKGLLIEPSPNAFYQLKINRPKCININCALVSNSEQRVISGTFASGSLLSSAHPEYKYRDLANVRNLFKGYSRLRRFFGFNPDVVEIDVPAKTFSEVCSENDIVSVDLMVIDVEGNELEVIKGFAKNVLPKLLVVETRESNIWGITAYLLKLGYILSEDLTQSIDQELLPREHRDFLWVRIRDEDLDDYK